MKLLTRNTYRVTARALGALGFTLLLAACGTNPVTGKQELQFISTTQEIAMGEQAYFPTRQAQGGDYIVHESVTAYVQQVNDRVAAASDRDLPYEIVVLNSSVPNAWAMPGGKIAINRGLLVELSNEAELAAVLAHEIVHAAARHGAKNIERGLLSQGIVTATAIGASASGTAYGGDIVNLVSGGAALFNQKYSRDAERESDYYGTLYMAEAGYNPYAAVTLQETFLELSGNRKQSFLDGLLASHPSSAERVENNRLLVKRLREEGYGDGVFKQAEYAAALAELRSAQAAYDAYDRAREAAGEGNFEAALTGVNTAIERYRREAAFHGLRGAIRMQQKRWNDAITNFDRAVALEDGFFAYYLQRGMAYSSLGERPAAKRDLDRSLALLPTSQALHQLGQIAEADGDAEAARRYYEQAAQANDSTGQAARVRLVEMTIGDQPARYVGARVRGDGAGAYWLEVTNQTTVPLAGVVVRVELVVNERLVEDNVRVELLGAQEGVRVTLRPSAAPTQANAYAVAARVAQ